jgi:nucleoside-diphosphate-sugar epimerase
MRVLLTGAFGNVGVHVLDHLMQMGYDVTCFDLKTGATERRWAMLARSRQFRTLWGDLRDDNAVARVVAQVQPQAIIHTAAVIPPMAYLQPEVAFDINVNGVRRLIQSAERVDPPPKFIFTSSYSVHGPRNPYRPLSLITSTTPLSPADSYGRHKVAAESLLRASRLPWTILRLSGVLSVEPEDQRHPAFRTFLYLLPYERRQHGIDARDVGLALANAIAVETEGRTYVIGGNASWQQRAGDLLARLFEARGLRPLPASAFRLPDSTHDASWYYEDWVDTRESQSMLCYQQHSFEEYLADVRQQSGWWREVTRVAAPLIRWQMLRASPYYGRAQPPDRRTFWETACATFDLPLETV